MSVAYYIVTQEEIEGVDLFVNGKAIAHANQKALEKLCAQLNVPAITGFVSQNPQELAEFIEDQGVEAPDELPEEQWFDPQEGLAVVRALRRHLAQNPGALKNAAAIMDELAEYEAVLEQLEARSIKWHLAIDF